MTKNTYVGTSAKMQGERIYGTSIIQLLTMTRTHVRYYSCDG